MTRTAHLVVPLLVVTACSGGGSSRSTGSVTTAGAPDAQTATVDMRNDLKFHPSTVRARVGTVTLTVTDSETVPHDLTFEDKALGGTGTVDGKSDTRLKVTFDQAGTYRFTCTIHPGMDGEVVVS